VRRRLIKRGVGISAVDGKSWRLADEVRYIQRRAALHDGRFISVGPLVLFSTDSGDAWLLDPSEQLAVRLARDGDPETVQLEETDGNFTVTWTGHYRIGGAALIYSDGASGRVVTILGYPTDRLAQLG